MTSQKIRTGSKISAHKISFSYARNRPILDSWSAEFTSGSVTALTGPSGRGKSTLLYLLGLMLAPTSGHIEIDGLRPTEMKDSARALLRAEYFGFVFQDAALDSTRTVLENVTEVALYRGVPRKQMKTRAESLLERFGVDVPSHRKPSQVSGGQAQRIALCRALLFAPPILLADEPTGNLDPVSASVVVEAMKQHAHEGATVVVVTHSPEVANACDRQVTL